ncbi:MAG: 6-carboxytetrahydropterin synthase QueD [Pontiellaceae bacterium]|jgi:6-pyruvoyltetrahydropterin/6-carboxytetrahydropterin synthase|nr:6-carboxytetrahydropterin synthase QueD [Pontiellaceae bacterium]
MPEMEIYKTLRFDAAHRLTGIPPAHKCSAMHGHGFEIEVCLRGPVDARTGFVMDFGELTKICEPVLKQLDHAILNDIEGLENPTSENISVWVWNRLKPQLPLLSRIVIRETATSGCIYCG